MAVGSGALVGVRTPIDDRVFFVESSLSDFTAGEWVLVEIAARELPARVVVSPAQLVGARPEPSGSLLDRIPEPDAEVLKKLASERDDPNLLGRVGLPAWDAQSAAGDLQAEYESPLGRVGQQVEIDGRAGVVVRLNVLEHLATVRFADGEEREVSRDALESTPDSRDVGN